MSLGHVGLKWLFAPSKLNRCAGHIAVEIVLCDAGCLVMNSFFRGMGVLYQGSLTLDDSESYQVNLVDLATDGGPELTDMELQALYASTLAAAINILYAATCTVKPPLLELVRICVC